MLAIGEKAPDFDGLLGTDGKRYSISSFKDKPVLAVIFSCNHCPYAVAYEDRIVAIQRDYAGKGVQFVVVNSNDDKSYPEDGYPEMIKRAKEKGFNFPYVRDADQTVAEEYGAVCTPHVFAFDKDRVLRYRGRIDDNREAGKAKTRDFRDALDDMVAERKVRVPDTKPFGCSIKWSAT